MLILVPSADSDESGSDSDESAHGNIATQAKGQRSAPSLGQISQSTTPSAGHYKKPSPSLGQVSETSRRDERKPYEQVSFCFFH